MDNTNPLAQSPYDFLQQQEIEQHHQQLQVFWTIQRQLIEQTNDFKNHHLPLARIKKIMKSDEDVRMISAEAPILFAKACEIFILELTIRSWLHAEENKRRTLQKNDIAAAITRTEIFDFLVDIVPSRDDDDNKDDASATAAIAGPEATGVPYYYPSMGQSVSPGIMMDQNPNLYLPPSQAWQSVWHSDVDGSYGNGQANPYEQG